MDKTLYLFGDSLTRGVVLDEATGKYRLTKASFSSSLATDCQYNIVNCSKLGLTIEKGLSIMRQKTSQEGYAILEYGGNDCDFFWDQVASNPDFKTQKCNVPPERFLSLYRQAVEYLRSRNVSPIICTPVSYTHLVLTPRVDMLAIDIDDSMDAIIELALGSPYSRIPVYEDSIDNIIGVLYLNPVSYTHLDVYKRQLLSCPGAHW